MTSLRVMVQIAVISALAVLSGTSKGAGVVLAGEKPGGEKVVGEKAAREEAAKDKDIASMLKKRKKPIVAEPLSSSPRLLSAGKIRQTIRQKPLLQSRKKEANVQQTSLEDARRLQEGPAEPLKRDKKKTARRLVHKRSGICRDLDRLARRYKLPPLFFARLIWQESRFDPYAISPAGAEGIAQFMPGTAAIWGLDDPFEPGQALIKSAQYLSYLKRKLGNLGLAAAGYNAGSGRVTDWLNGKGYMPLETRNYVRIITGYSIEDWADGKASFVGIRVKKKMPASACKQLSIALRGGQGKLIKASFSRSGRNSLAKKRGRGSKSRRLRLRRYARRLPHMPWGVQLAGSFSRAQAMKQFRAVKRKYAGIIGSRRIVLKSSRQQGRGRRVFHRVRIGTSSRKAANQICKRLKSAGGNCVVLKN